jgi:invasion protein IalB
MVAGKVVNVSFVALAGAKKVMVPVSLTGFGDAAAALGLAGK